MDFQYEQEPVETPVPRNLAKERLQIAMPAFSVAMVFLIASVVQGVAHALVMALQPSIAENDWYPWVASMIPMYCIAMPISFIFMRFSKSEPPSRQSMRPLVFVGLIALCFGLTYAGNFVGSVVNAILSMLTGQEMTNDLENLTMSSPFWVNLLFCGILAPILEELFYRKLVIDRLRRYGDLPALLLSGIAFGLIHGNFYQFFYAAMLGMLFGYIYLNTGKIRYTIAIHMAINLVGGVYTTEMMKRLDLELLASDPMAALTQNTTGMLMYFGYLAFVMCMIAGAVIALVLLLIFCRRPLRRAEQPLTAREWVRVLLLNPGVWIFLVVCILLFL